MFTGPSYSTKTLRRPPTKSSFFQIAVENDWDFLAEAIVGSAAQSSTQIDEVVLLLESHGVVVHRIPAPPLTSQPKPRSPFLAEPANNDSYGPNTAAQRVDDRISVDDPALLRSNLVSTPSPLLFPRNAALVHGTRVIEAPPSVISGSQNLQQDSSRSTLITRADALFKMLESSGVEVIRWPSSRLNREKQLVPEEQLVDVAPPKGVDTEDEGPRFSPSDIVILSPTLLITRLSSFTNNKGLEYLWSALSRPSGNKNHPSQSGEPRGSGHSHPAETLDPINALLATTTLLVRIADPNSPASNLNSPSVPPTPPRTPTFSFSASQAAPQNHINPATYIPLCRALVPIDRRVMLYDPALVVEGEARRLKSVLDRVEEASGGGDVRSGGSPLMERHSKRDSIMSYGTFGSLDPGGDEGWQFISVDGLHSISILLVFPELALLSPLASAPTTGSSTPPSSHEDTINNISQVLETFGVRAIKLPFTDLNGVRDAVLVLRRESNLAAESAGPAVGEQETWDQSGREEQTEGCFGAICATLSTWLCGTLTNSDSASTADISDTM